MSVDSKLLEYWQQLDKDHNDHSPFYTFAKVAAPRSLSVHPSLIHLGIANTS